ncbi:hypothetical protein [Lysobacter sp. ESA13C]|uniref:hypothetical protein n=1 Tax=Lysobacter sp. ESA13C TaxID=2862676 RepID=UPI001CBF071A|nr:hypothetical protein [Lysobacter sp. ESA13C]
MALQLLFLMALSNGQAAPARELDLNVLASEYGQYFACVHDAAAKFASGVESTATEIATAALHECSNLGNSARSRARQKVIEFNQSSLPAQRVPLNWVDETYELVIRKARDGAVADVVKLRAK